jgi:hypothetical protein
MLKFDKNDLSQLEENSRSKLVLVENNYKGTTFKKDFKNKMLNKDKLRIVKGNKNVCD